MILWWITRHSPTLGESLYETSDWKFKNVFLIFFLLGDEEDMLANDNDLTIKEKQKPKILEEKQKELLWS